jgi:hypothetical protein
MRRFLLTLGVALGLSLLLINRPSVPQTATADPGPDATSENPTRFEPRPAPELPTDRSPANYPPGYFDALPERSAPATPPPAPPPTPSVTDRLLAETEPTHAPAAAAAAAGAVVTATTTEAPDAPEAQPTDPVANLESDQPGEPAPVADAGPEQIVWIGAPSVILPAQVTGGGGGLEYTWAQTAGPTLVLDDPTAPAPALTGFNPRETRWQDQIAEFALLVTDAYGRESFDTLTVRLRSAPDLALIPDDANNSSCSKYFRMVDGVMLAHFECHTQQPAGPVARFAVDTAAALTLTPLTDAEQNFSHSFIAGRHLYEIELYESATKAESRLVFFIETEHGIPAILVLVAAW